MEVGSAMGVRCPELNCEVEDEAGLSVHCSMGVCSDSFSSFVNARMASVLL